MEIDHEKQIIQVKDICYLSSEGAFSNQNRVEIISPRMQSIYVLDLLFGLHVLNYSQETPLKWEFISPMD